MWHAISKEITTPLPAFEPDFCHAPHSYSQPGVFGSKIVRREAGCPESIGTLSEPILAAWECRAGTKSRQRTFQRMSVQVVNLSVRTIKMRSPNAVLRCEKFIRLCQRFFSRSAPGQPPPPAQVGKTKDHKKSMLAGEFRTWLTWCAL